MPERPAATASCTRRVLKKGEPATRRTSACSCGSEAKASSISRALVAFNTRYRTPIERTASSTSFSVDCVTAELLGSDRVSTSEEHDGNSRCCGLDREGSELSTCCGDHGDPPAHQIGREFRHSFRSVFAPAIFDLNVFAIDETRLLESLTQIAMPHRECLRRS